MGAYQGKYHIAIDTIGYILGRSRTGSQYYQKKRAPAFVNKFGSGDISYRDATFWQFFAQTNWRNGAQQLKWDDAGKFWKSQDVEVGQLEKMTLSKALVSAGQTEAGVKINFITSWRNPGGTSAFNDGSDGAYAVTTNTTDAPIDSAAVATMGTKAISATNVSFAAGQRILIIQSRGTNAGQKEELTIESYSAGTIVTTTPLTYTYTTGAQVLVLKRYSSVTIDAGVTLTGKAWNGTTGGVLGWYCNGETKNNGTISLNGKGYRNNSSEGAQGEGSAGAGSVSYSNNGNAGGGGQKGTDATGGGGGANGGGAQGGGGKVGYSGGYSGAAVGDAALATMFFGGAGGNGSGSNGWSIGGSGGGIVFITSKTFTNSGAITANGVNGSNASGGGTGGGGAGGSILIKSQTAVLGSGTITANGGAAGTTGLRNGGAGGSGRIHVGYSSSYSGTTSPTADVSQDSSLVDTPASTSSTAYIGTSSGKIYTWDNGTTMTEVYDTRALTLYNSGYDADKIVGDVGGVETAQSQGFKLATATKVKAVKLYLKKNAGTPGNITVTIETDNTAKPSGTLADAKATATLPAFTTATYGWIVVEFAENFSLAAATQYHIVLKTAAAANDNNYAWGVDASSPGYADGAMSVSVDGGASWSAVTDSDAYFAVLSNATSANCALITKVGGTKKMYIGTGDPSGSENGDARLYAFDGTIFTLVKTFATSIESTILAMTEYTQDNAVYVSIGPMARIYKTTDFSTFTLDKDIDVPDNPGYCYAIKEYNSFLYASGGSPELVPSQYYSGFIYYNDTTTWRSLYPFDFSVIKSMEFYDAYLFLGTYHGQIYIFDTSSLNPLFSFKDMYEWQVQVLAMKYFDDKIYFALYPQDGTSETNVGVWIFDRRGLHLAHTVAGVTGFSCFGVVNGTLLVGTGNNGYVYQLSTTTYKSTGYYQSSYYDANLPSIDKLYKEVTIKHDPLPAGTSISVYYRFKESDSWTLLGTSDVDGAEEKTMSFAAATHSKKITLKGELNTSDTSVTPTLTEVVMKYSLLPDPKWQWTFRILAKAGLHLLDKSVETKTAAQIRAAVDASAATDGLVTFIDIDGTSHDCLFNDTSNEPWVIDEAVENENMITINLVEA